MIPEIAAELDRQLSEQRASAESSATRAGLLIAAAAAILGFAAGGKVVPTSPIGFWILGGSILFGVFVFWMARVSFGPMLSLAVMSNSASDLEKAKLVLVEGNKSVLARTQVVYSIQVILTVGGIVTLAIQLWPVP